MIVQSYLVNHFNPVKTWVHIAVIWLLLCLFPVTKMVPSVQILNFKQSRMETCWMCSAVEICVKENFAMCSSVNHKCSQHSQPMCPSVNEYIGMCLTVNNVHWTYLWTSTLDFAQLWTSAMCVDCSCLIVGKPLDERPPVKEHIRDNIHIRKKYFKRALPVKLRPPPPLS